MNRIFRNTVFWLFLFLVIIGIISFAQNDGGDTNTISSTEFNERLSENEFATITLQPEGGVYNVTAATSEDTENAETYESYIPMTDESTQQLQTAQGPNGNAVEFDTQPEEETSGWVTFLTTMIPFIIIFLLFFFLLSQSQGGGSKMMNFGKSKAKMYQEDKKKVRFKDVAGAEEEKQELIEVVDFLKDARKFSNIGARIPKGVLLVGPPGTGKTLIAQAVAGEADVPFFSISGSDFVEMFVGVGASRVRDLFENAKKNSPCIIFIDEIDAVGRQRGAGVGGGHDEREQTLNQLLVEMDGFAGNEGIIIIAATNRADVLDPALLRPGRFDRQILIGRPDVNGREEILQVHARNKPLAEDVNFRAIAQRTPGFTGADLENLLNEAALVAARADMQKIRMTHVEEAIDRVIAGPSKKSRVISEKERNIVAHHEAGHTVVGMKLENADMVHKVTIVPRGQAGGYAMMLPKEDRYFMTKPELLDKIVGLLGGRVAEEVMFNEVSTGAHNDFQRATDIARRMVTEYGMSEKLGPLQFGSSSGGQVFLGRDMQNEQNYSDAIAHEIDNEMQRIIMESYERCKQILTQYKDRLELVAQSLLELETLDAEQIRSLVEDGKLPEDHYSNKSDEEMGATKSDEQKREEEEADHVLKDDSGESSSEETSSEETTTSSDSGSDSDDTNRRD